ncbi:unnamed protein product [Lactuca saligna]|uniref:Uncharacterized protein n=1 Tax=Lactuca saligna TaxID=75948 RepID=A0AA35YUH5_LACSI|nr:unnamed protein product [Lactuca saligna]
MRQPNYTTQEILDCLGINEEELYEFIGLKHVHVELDISQEGMDPEGIIKEDIGIEGIGKEGMEQEGMDQEGMDQDGMGVQRMDQEGINDNGMGVQEIEQEGLIIEDMVRKPKLRKRKPLERIT